MHTDQAISLMVIATAALLLPNVAERLKVPPVVAEILFGVFIGKSLLNIPISGEWVNILAEIGFLMLMFLAGAEIDFTMLEKRTSREFILFGLIFGGTLLLSYLFALFLGRGFFLALVLSTTSLGLVLPALRERGLSQTMLGQSILVSAVLADFLTFFGITFYVLFVTYGFTWRLIAPLPVFAVFGVLLWAMRLWVWWNPEKARVLVGKSGPSELGVRFSVALIFIFVALSELAGLEPVLGAFMGGCLLSFIFREKERLDEKLASLAYGFLIPFFFIRVGINFDLGNILNPATLIFIALLVAAAFAVKIVPSMLFMAIRVPPRFAVSAGILLSARLTLIIAAAAIGLREGFIDPALRDSIVFLALVTSVTAPTVFRRIMPQKE
jgi:Kef-type K+ transport system membrane component KefB